MKALQKFTPEYLKECKKLSPEEILEFIENFKSIISQSQENDKSCLISLKIPQSLLSAFKTKAQINNLRYQTQIKKLMRDWVLDQKWLV